MIAQEIAKLPVMTLPQLQELWQKYFDTPATSQNKDFYISRIAYRMQELQYGGLGTATKIIFWIFIYKLIFSSKKEKKEETNKIAKPPPIIQYFALFQAVVMSVNIVVSLSFFLCLELFG